MKFFILASLLLSVVSCGKGDSSTPIKGKSLSNIDAPIHGPNVPYLVDSEIEDDAGTGEGTGSSSDEVSTTKNFVCDFSNENETTQVKIRVQKSGELKVATLILDSDDKFTFDGFTLSPSGNENASVHHAAPDTLVEDGKVIKIMARIVMNEEINEGELQVSYKVKVDKNMIETDFAKLALIDHCSLQ